jgi:hypothetical protein
VNVGIWHIALFRCATEFGRYRGIDEKWGDIANALSRIEIQTTLTNGRVRKLKRWQS